jgi:ATP-dependent Lon protease
VRNLERELAKLARKGLTKILKKEVETVEVTPDTLEDMLGVRRYKYGLAELEDQVGVVTGLPGPPSAATCCRSRRCACPARAG